MKPWGARTKQAIGLSPRRYPPRSERILEFPAWGLNALGVGIPIGVAFKIPQQQVFTIAADDVSGQQGDLAAAARSVDHERRHGIPGRMPAQALDDLQSL